MPGEHRLDKFLLAGPEVAMAEEAPERVAHDDVPIAFGLWTRWRSWTR